MSKRFIDRVGGLTWMSRIRAGTSRCISAAANSGSTANRPRNRGSSL